MKTTGLTLVEAVKSGRRFKRSFQTIFMSFNNERVMYAEDAYPLSRKDILAEDYILEPVKVEIDREMLAKAWDKEVCCYPKSGLGNADTSDCFALFCKELGL